MIRSLFASFAVASLAFASVACSAAPGDASTAGSAAVTSESSATAADTSAARIYLAGSDAKFTTVNEESTACADGSREDSCEVNNFDFSALGLSTDDATTLEAQVRAGTAMVQGTLAQVSVPLGGGSRAIELQATLTVTAAWVSPAAAPATFASGNFQMVTKNVASCNSINQSGTVTCDPYELVMVNKSTEAGAPAIDLTGASASAAAVTSATSALAGSGLLTFGYFEGTAKGPKTYEITAFFLPVSASN